MALRLIPECRCLCKDVRTDAQQVDGIHWHKCACTKCGLPGRGCDVNISVIAIGVIAAMRGKEMPSSSLEAGNNPGFCSDCRDHNLLDLQIMDQLDVLRARKKRARVAGHVPEMCQECADRLTRELEAGHKSEGSHIDGERLATMCE